MLHDPADPTMDRQSTFRRAAHPWTAILIITGLFQVFRGAPVDGAFFLVIAGVLVADAFGLVALPDRRMPRRSVVFGTAAVLGVLMVIAPRHGFVEGLIVSAIGVTVLLFAWPDPGTTSVRKLPLRRAAVVWSIIAVVIALWELTSFFLGLPSPEAEFRHPSISLLLDPVLNTVEGRIGFTALWLVSGIALLRRGRAR